MGAVDAIVDDDLAVAFDHGLVEGVEQRVRAVDLDRAVLLRLQRVP